MIQLSNFLCLITLLITFGQLQGQPIYKEWVVPSYGFRTIPMGEHASKKTIYYGTFSEGFRAEQKKSYEELAGYWKHLRYFKIKKLHTFDSTLLYPKKIWETVLKTPELAFLSINMKKKSRSAEYFSFANPNLQDALFKPLTKHTILEGLKVRYPDTSQAFLNYIGGFPKLKTLEWVSMHRMLDFSQLSNVETLVLRRSSHYNHQDSSKSLLQLPLQLKRLILTHNSINEVLPTIAKHQGSLKLLKARYFYSDSLPNLALLQGKVDHLMLDYLTRKRPLPKLPRADSNLQALTLEVHHYHQKRVIDLDTEIGNYKHLSYLDLSDYAILKLPASFYQLKQLQHLYLKTYSFSDSIQNFQQLETLKVRAKKLKTLPKGFAKLQQLKELEIFSDRMHRFPSSIYQLKSLEKLTLDHVAYRTPKRPLFQGISPKGLSQLKQLKYFEFPMKGILFRQQLKNIYHALPDSTEIQINFASDRYEISMPFNLGIYVQYDVTGTVMSGLEFNYHYETPWDVESLYKKNGIIKKKNVDTYREPENPFDFHSFNFGIEWNYLKSFIMGYKIGYTYTHKRIPLALQTDFIAYTDYQGGVDLRATPKIGVNIPIGFGVLYLMYGYKLPMLPKQEFSLVPRHSISLTMRLIGHWPPLGPTILFW